MKENPIPNPTMEEERIQSSIYKNTRSFSSIRFMGILKQPPDSDSDSNSLELEESELFWSPSSDSPNSNTPANSRRNTFRPEKFGLSGVFSEDHHHPLVQRNPSFTAARTIPPVPRPEEFSGQSPVKFNQSAPVNVPVFFKGNSGKEKLGFFDEGDGEMIPPHEMIARSQMGTFSVFEGVGRTFKGRDLRRVRNTVWQKTGFLE
ncbi:uncharacterized protein LOC143876486 [Tasmannia lanceolata]|uniref:uncharacterized protein LOC143876486 n=1 Tax=Tasmannia lanceolata TaxID=3420 RepID=UPI004062EAC1